MTFIIQEKHSDKEFFSHQEFVINYLQKNSPYRGFTIYHGLGAGKTASSVAISDGLNSDKKIVVMLPSLRTNYENEIKQWGNMMFKKVNIGVLLSLEQIQN